ncbi:MAG: hypothetical protein RMK99_13565 [Anaerolineales bacterium]|nr:hypothetical protein [Anaerolineales bacterium]
MKLLQKLRTHHEGAESTAMVVIMVLAILGPTIGNVFSNIIQRI